jgi:hypothetical protein
MGSACCTDDGERPGWVSKKMTRHRGLYDQPCCPGYGEPSENAPDSLVSVAGAKQWDVQGLAGGCSSRQPLLQDAVHQQQLESMLLELFTLHDLNGNGLLEEDELVALNVKIAMLHHGKDIDRGAIKNQYVRLFREKLDPQGRPVPYSVFRNYMHLVLSELDRDPVAQEMILEQFAAEAKSGRAAFWIPSFASVRSGG